jgi:hypothetical protein
VTTVANGGVLTCNVPFHSLLFAAKRTSIYTDSLEDISRLEGGGG